MINKFFKKVKGIWSLIVLGLSILYFSYITLRVVVRDYILDNNFKIITGVVINERNYIRNDKVAKAFSYSYEFILHGKKYRKNSNEKTLQVGDSVLIKYYPNYPEINKFLKQKNEDNN